MNPEKENPGALAGATGADVDSKDFTDQHTLIEMQKTSALVDALLACERDDRVPFLETLLEELRPGWPQMPFLCGLMEEARFWAGGASRAELKAYCLACYEAMSEADRRSFVSYVTGGRHG